MAQDIATQEGDAITIEPVTIELDIGYKDPRGTIHRRVTFGKRINGKALFAIDEDVQSSSPTQHADLLQRASMTEFGEMKMPVPLKVLLSLDSLDREDIADAYRSFSEQSFGQRTMELLSPTTLRLFFGWERNGLVYDTVEFGKRLTGETEVRADVAGYRLGTVRRVLYLAGQQVTRLSQSNGPSILEGPMTIEQIESLDIADVMALRAGAEVWRESFRRAGARVQKNGSSNGLADSNGDGLERERDPGLIN